MKKYNPVPDHHGGCDMCEADMSVCPDGDYYYIPDTVKVIASLRDEISLLKNHIKSQENKHKNYMILIDKKLDVLVEGTKNIRQLMNI